MRRKFIGANWKMNLSKTEAIQLFQEISMHPFNHNRLELVIFPSQAFLGLFNGSDAVSIGAQNAFGPDLFGAFTGETSLAQLKELGISSVLVGHSERRVLFHEQDEFLCAKAMAAIELGFQVIYCCGEPLAVREDGNAIKFIENQLIEFLRNLKKEHLANVVIAYEPIWAIGTGKVPALQEVQQMHSSIRGQVRSIVGAAAADSVRIIYGGSCNAENAKSIFNLPDVDGGLIGGASLDATTFKAIIAET